MTLSRDNLKVGDAYLWSGNAVTIDTVVEIVEDRVCFLEYWVKDGEIVTECTYIDTFLETRVFIKKGGVLDYLYGAYDCPNVPD